MALAFFGTAPFGAAILDGLLARREVALVVSQPDRPAGRGKQVSAPPVAQLARERGLRLEQPERTHDEDMLATYAELGIDTIVVAAFGQMIREPLLSDYLMLNVHGSLLPKWRGAAPVERSIMAGESQTGVCIMQMEAGLDTGPVCRTGHVDVDMDDDAGVVYERLADVGVELLLDALDAADVGALEFRAQPEHGATYAHKIEAADRRLDLTETERAVHDRVRALSPHIGAWVSIDGQRLGIWRTQIDPAPPVGLAAGELWHDDQRLVLGCSDGTVDVRELQPAGKRRMPAADWLRGLRAPLGTVDPPVPAG
jgi:methionyl-tRNA formyltransferase